MEIQYDLEERAGVIWRVGGRIRRPDGGVEELRLEPRPWPGMTTQSLVRAVSSDLPLPDRPGR